jgi:uncharacterized protein
MFGVRESIEPWARQVVRSYMPQEHREFHTALPFLVAAARDQLGRPWATILTGAEGFVSSPDSRHLEIAASPTTGDALENQLAAGTDVGLLGIDLGNRRRNRLNGRVGSRRAEGFSFAVDQSFGNCPQYIRERQWTRRTHEPSPAVRESRLTSQMQHWCERADTLFIASGHRSDAGSRTFGMDASHRGGPPGFVQVQGSQTLLIPDYAGNNHYNTIGNLVMDPRMGLVFVDFESGGMLQLTG